MDMRRGSWSVCYAHKYSLRNTVLVTVYAVSRGSQGDSLRGVLETGPTSTTLYDYFYPT